jgi:hypothetical protein
MGFRGAAIAAGAIPRTPVAPGPDSRAVIEIAGRGSNDARRDSLSEIFCEEIDAWARQALGANGFGDLP